MKKIFLILNFSFLIFNFLYAQPAIQWQKCYGGTGDDVTTSIQQTVDGGYIVAGWTHSNDGDVTGNHGSRDYWVVKLDSSGIIQWQKCLGGTSDDWANSVQQTADSGYIVAGSTSSHDGDVTGNHSNLGYNDYWVIKLEHNGNVQWQKCLGGLYNDEAYSVRQTGDGGYIVAGRTASNDGDVTGNHSTAYDYWIVKLNISGNIQWQKCLGGTNEDIAYSAQQTSDGGYIVAGYTYSNDGDVTGNHSSGPDYWLVKLNSNGNIQWQKCLGGTDGDWAYSVEQTADGGYIVAGWTLSNDGDITGNHGGADYWIAKLDSSGIIQWQKCLGGTSDDWANSIQQTSDGGFIVSGYTECNDGDVTGNHGSNDYWIIKLDSGENIQWQKCLGGTSVEQANSVQQTSDGGFIVSGYTGSNNGDVTGNHGTWDYWVVKLYPYVLGTEEESSNVAFSIFPNPFTTQATITFRSTVHNANFSLYNLLGEKITETTGINGESYQLNRGNLQSGVYVFELIEKGGNIGRGKAVVY